MTSSCSWKLKPRVFVHRVWTSVAQLDSFTSKLPLYSLKENTTASELTGHWPHVILPGYSQQPLELLLGRTPLLGLSGTPVLCCLLTSLFVSVSHPFSSHKSFVFKLSASSNSLCDSISLFPPFFPKSVSSVKTQPH